MTEQQLTALATRALLGLGLAAHDAAQVARILVMGDMFGHHTHGVLRLESYGQRVDLGAIRVNAPIRVTQAAPAMLQVDGGSAMGPLVGMRALEAAMACARETGLALALVRNGNHFGAIGPYCYLAAAEGFASIIGSNASTTIAPTGGREERVGNNPLGMGVPRPGGDPVILDMAMSVVARGKIRAALKRGEAIPDTWATDRGGKPTTDPQAALEGFLQPMGGYKGYGLALMVDLFAGVLSGAGYLTHVSSWMDEPEEPGNLGQFFLLVDTRRLGSGEWLAQRMADFAAIIHATPAAEAELASLERHRRDGIEIDAALVTVLEGFAARTPRPASRAPGS
jgi:ureidoglycolate dehydrogenase (NAD+)